MGFTIAVYGVFSRTEGEVLGCLHGLLWRVAEAACGCRIWEKVG